MQRVWVQNLLWWIVRLGSRLDMNSGVLAEGLRERSPPQYLDETRRAATKPPYLTSRDENRLRDPDIF